MIKTAQTYLGFTTFFFIFLFWIFIQFSVASNDSEVSFDYTLEDGELFVDIVDEVSGATISEPLIDFGVGVFSNDPSLSEGVLGTSSESVRVFNYTHNPTWTLNIAGENVEHEWEHEVTADSYPFNHAIDENLGRLTVHPEELSLSSDVGCSIDNINLGSEASFVSGLVDSVDIASAISTASAYCRFDLQDIDLSQVVPASQPVGTYTLGMVLTVSEGYFEASSEPQNLIVSFEEEKATLEWEEPGNTGSDAIEGYMIERTDSPWSVLVANTNSTETSYVDSTITGDHHRYRVSAVSNAGVGDVSDVPMYTVTYISSEGGSVLPKSRTLVDGGVSSVPEVLGDSGYVLSEFEIMVGEDNGVLNTVTGEVTNVIGDMTIRANFELDVDYSCYLQQENNTGLIPLEDRNNFVTECPTSVDWTRTSVNPEIWLDNVTGLYWTSRLSTNRNRTQAVTDCIDLVYWNRDDWRLPTKDELMQIAPASNTHYKPGNDMFGSTGASFTGNSWFWAINLRLSNSRWVSNPASGAVSFDTPEATHTHYHSVRCVTRD